MKTFSCLYITTKRHNGSIGLVWSMVRNCCRMPCMQNIPMDMAICLVSSVVGLFPWRCNGGHHRRCNTLPLRPWLCQHRHGGDTVVCAIVFGSLRLCMHWVAFVPNTVHSMHCKCTCRHNGSCTRLSNKY